MNLAVSIAAVGDDLLAGLDAATTGEDEVNPAYREMDRIWEQPVACLSASRVREVAEMLQSLTPSASLADEIARRVFLDVRPGYRPHHPGDDRRSSYDALRAIYVTAAQRGLCTLMWWD